jgi:hypothetical protein
MMNEKLAMKASYLDPTVEILYGISPNLIREYDMSSAGLSVIKDRKLLPNEDIQMLSAMPKYERNVVVGKIRAIDKDFSKKLTAGIRESIRNFLIENGYEDENLLAINNDSVTVLEHRNMVPKLDFGEVHFRKAEEYIGYLRLNRFAVFINRDLRSIKIKGVGETARRAFQEGLGKVILSWFKRMERGETSISLLKDLRELKREIVELRAPTSYYVSLKSGFIPMTLNFKSAGIVQHLYADFPDEFRKDIDLTCVLEETILPLCRILKNGRPSFNS